MGFNLLIWFFLLSRYYSSYSDRDVPFLPYSPIYHNSPLDDAASPTLDLLLPAGDFDPRGLLEHYFLFTRVILYQSSGFAWTGTRDIAGISFRRLSQGTRFGFSRCHSPHLPPFQSLAIPFQPHCHLVPPSPPSHTLHVPTKAGQHAAIIPLAAAASLQTLTCCLFNNWQIPSPTQHLECSFQCSKAQIVLGY